MSCNWVNGDPLTPLFSTSSSGVYGHMMKCCQTIPVRIQLRCFLLRTGWRQWGFWRTYHISSNTSENKITVVPFLWYNWCAGTRRGRQKYGCLKTWGCWPFQQGCYLCTSDRTVLNLPEVNHELLCFFHGKGQIVIMASYRQVTHLIPTCHPIFSSNKPLSL